MTLERSLLALGMVIMARNGSCSLAGLTSFCAQANLLTYGSNAAVSLDIPFRLCLSSVDARTLADLALYSPFRTCG